MRTHFKLNLLVAIFCSAFLISCSEDSGPNNVGQQHSKTEMGAESTGHPLLVEFINNSFYINNKAITADNFDELDGYLNDGKITENEYPEVATAMGFNDVNEFNRILNSQSALAKQIEKKFDFSNLTVQQQDELVRLGFHEAGFITTGDDHCGETYQLCCVKAVALDLIMTAGCTATGPFALFCGGAAAVWTAAQVEQCRLDREDCENAQQSA